MQKRLEHSPDMRSIRISILYSFIMLICIGVVMIYSSSGIYANERYGDSLYFLKKHLLYLFIGLVSSVALMLYDYRRLQAHSKKIIIFIIFLLVLVYVPGIGREVSGARRWIRFGLFSFQPSEFAKIGLLVYLADYFSRKQGLAKDFFRGFMPAMIVAGSVIMLVFLQPDLGTSVAMGILTLILFFIAGVNVTHIASLIALSLPVLYFVIFTVPYRRKRIMAFIDPWADPQGTGFQIVQSFIALGSGGLFGVGLGCSKQKLFYLPESHTDFIFSIIGEELGLLGTLSIAGIFFILIWQGMRVAFKCQDTFGRYLAFGIVSMVALEVIINIAVSTGAMPTKGLPLPFISYGGTSLIFHMSAIAILLNIAKGR